MYGVENKALQSFNREINQFDEIVIYGAGLYGQALVKSLYDSKIYKRLHFAVSEKKTDEYVMGLEVIDIRDVKEWKRNYCVVLAVGCTLEKEMIETLQSLGVENIIRLEENFRGLLRKRYSEGDKVVEPTENTAVSTHNESELLNRIKSQEELLREVYIKLSMVENDIEALKKYQRK